MKDRIITNIVKFLIIFALLTSSVRAGSTPYPIYGKVTVGSSIAPGMQISITDLRTNEVVNLYTDIHGWFMTDFSKFKDYPNFNDQFRVTYCISDSRCNQIDSSFYLSGNKIDLSRDIPIDPSNPPLGPYPIAGIVEDADNWYNNVEVIVTNINKANFESTQTNEYGEYGVNLANIGTYDTGDLIRACYLSYCNEGFVTNQPLELNIFISEATPTIPDDEDDWDYDDGCDPTLPGCEEEKEDDKDEPKPDDEDEPDENIPPDKVDDTDAPIKWKGILLAIIVILIALGVGLYYYLKIYRKG